VNEHIQASAILVCTRARPGIAPQRWMASAIWMHSLRQTRLRLGRSVTVSADRADFARQALKIYTDGSFGIHDQSWKRVGKTFVLRLVAKTSPSCGWASVQLSSGHRQTREEQQSFSQNPVGNLNV
jgi:hypothetical protein